MGFVLILLVLLVCSFTQVNAVCVSDDLTVNTLSGVSLFENGTPLNDLVIRLEKGWWRSKPFRTIKTNSDGSFSFEPIRSGKYKLIIENEGLVNLTVGILVKREDSSPRQGVKILMAIAVPGNCSEASVIKLPESNGVGLSTL